MSNEAIFVKKYLFIEIDKDNYHKSAIVSYVVFYSLPDGTFMISDTKSKFIEWNTIEELKEHAEQVEHDLSLKAISIQII